LCATFFLLLVRSLVCFVFPFWFRAFGLVS
jgi:hypothetical protein